MNSTVSGCFCLAAKKLGGKIRWKKDLETDSGKRVRHFGVLTRSESNSSLP